MGRPRTNPLSPELARVLQVAGVKNVHELAAKVGLRRTSVVNWPKPGRRIPPDALQEIADRLGVPVESFSLTQTTGTRAESTIQTSETLVMREGGARYVAAATHGVPDSQPALLTWSGDGHATRFQVVPRFAVRASAGGGNGCVDEEQIGEVAFEVNWMRRHLGRSGRGFASIEVRGDSMQPTLIHGDEIIIDRHVQRVDVNGIYVIALRGDLLVKRIQRMLDGSLVVKSDNPAYEPETIRAEMAEDFRVVGRMVWPRVR